MNDNTNKMMQKYLEEYAKIKYDQEDNILNYLNYFIAYKSGKNNTEIDKLWFEEIGKSNGLEIDTIFSVWTVLKRYFELENITPQSNLKKQYKQLLKVKEDYLTWVKSHTVDKDIKEFINIASERCNVMRYSNEKFKVGEGYRNFNTDRGLSLNDEIPISISMCFNNHKYSFLFGNNKPYKSVEDWINSEKLNCLFNGEIKKENIKNIGKLNKDKIANWKKFDLNDLKEIAREYKTILLERNNDLINKE